MALDLGTGELFAKIAKQRQADDEAARMREEAGVQSAKNVGKGGGAIIGGILAAPGGPAAIAAGAAKGAAWGEMAGGAAAGETPSAEALTMHALRAYGSTYEDEEGGDGD